MSLPADDETKLARRAAHVALEALVKKRGWQTRDAYKWIQSVMGLSQEQAHIGLFDQEACARLTSLIYEELDDRPLQ